MKTKKIALLAVLTLTLVVTVATVKADTLIEHETMTNITVNENVEQEDAIDFITVTKDQDNRYTISISGYLQVTHASYDVSQDFKTENGKYIFVIAEEDIPKGLVVAPLNGELEYEKNITFEEEIELSLVMDDETFADIEAEGTNYDYNIKGTNDMDTEPLNKENLFKRFINFLRNLF